MSWHGGTEIFDRTCTVVVQEVQAGKIQPDSAELILTNLVSVLRLSDWGDPEESLDKFDHLPYVVAAFSANGIVDETCADCGEYPDDHCDHCGECGCEGECEDEDEEEGQ